MIPHDFENYIRMTHHVQVDGKVNCINTELTFKPFRRLNDEYSTEYYLNSLYPENLFLDALDRNLYYKGKDGSVYKVNFEKMS